MASMPPRPIREQVSAVLSGRKPERTPFISRLELWHKTHLRAGSLPTEIRDLSLTEIHRRVGVGRQQFMAAYGQRLRGVELIVKFRGTILHHEIDPVVEYFPRLPGFAVQDKIGLTDITLLTPVGSLTIQYEMLAEMLAAGTEAYMRAHAIKMPEDYRIVEFILERMEWVPQYAQIQAMEAELGDIGYVVPMMGRTPFQQLLLEYLGEVNAFYALNDDPRPLARVVSLLDARITEALDGLGNWAIQYIEFGDNLHGLITNPGLFREYCLPYYQRYADILHAQGKKMGSHTDGDVRSLLGLLAASGLDVAESFSPAPLTTCTNEDALAAWPYNPIIWGGIPSTILEDAFPESEFRDYVTRLLDLIGDRPIILGVGDQVMGNDLIDRVRWVAEQVEVRA